ncbi:MAG: phosphotransferase [Pseudomonadota bacterium]
MTEVLPNLLRTVEYEGSWSAEPIPGDASNRSWFRVKAGEKTFIVMLLAEGFNSLAEQNTKTNRKITEPPIVDLERYFSNHGVRIPKLLAQDVHRGIFLMEDFGDRLLQDVVYAGKPTAIRPLYENALDQLERIAVIAPNDPKSSIAFARSFDLNLFNWEFTHFVEFAIDKRIPGGPKPTDRQTILTEFEKLTAEYLTWEKVIVHRDYHSRNLMVLSANEVGVIDFQDALLGPALYDLASLLRDSYARLDPKMQDELVDRYRNQLKAKKIKGTASREKFRRSFDWMGIHRNLKAAGRFCYFDSEKGNRRYLPHVPRTLGYVRETLDRYRELKDLRHALLPYFDELIRSCG